MPQNVPDFLTAFREETAANAALFASVHDWHAPTLFKAWTPWDILAHLHIWNVAALESLTAPERFQAFLAEALPVVAEHGHQHFQRDRMAGREGPELLAQWQATVTDMLTAFATVDPETRVAWAGPPMSAASSLVARQMEHWAHTQAVHDLLGRPRENSDRLWHIADLGVRTYSFSHRIRGQEPPRPKPYVRLTAPSGAVWEWNDPQDDNCVEGSAEGFAQTVTQCRNVLDTDVVCVGGVAESWMQNAQCFAGAAEMPPRVGERN